MSFTDRLVAGTEAAPRIPVKRTAPTGFEPGIKYEAGEPAQVTLALKEVPADEQEWRDEIKRVTTLDLPDNRRVEIAQVRYWGDPKQPMVYVRFNITDREVETEAEDVATLLAIAKANSRRKPPTKTSDLTRVVVVSDAQIGKVGSRGGTPALLERITTLLAQLDDEMKAVPASDALIVDPGDLCEGFENVAAQQFTNDLSHPAQLRVARAVLTEIVTRVASRHTDTRVATVPSNHTAWRRGKNVLGKPTDDYGIDVHAAVAEALARDPKFRHVAWAFPSEWDESLALQVRGAIIGVAHGHQKNGPDQIPAWWKGQAHGSQPVAAASILITGHFHHLRVQPSGAIDGHARWWIQAPTLDNGSDWYRNSSGEDSEPGLLTFTIDDAGRWDNLRLITHDV